MEAATARFRTARRFGVAAICADSVSSTGGSSARAACAPGPRPTRVSLFLEPVPGPVPFLGLRLWFGLWTSGRPRDRIRRTFALSQGRRLGCPKRRAPPGTRRRHRAAAGNFAASGTWAELEEFPCSDTRRGGAGSQVRNVGRPESAATTQDAPVRSGTRRRRGRYGFVRIVGRRSLSQRERRLAPSCRHCRAHRTECRLVQ